MRGENGVEEDGRYPDGWGKRNRSVFEGDPEDQRIVFRDRVMAIKELSEIERAYVGVEITDAALDLAIRKRIFPDDIEGTGARTGVRGKRRILVSDVRRVVAEEEHST